MKIHVRALCVEKSGNEPDESEDAWAYNEQSQVVAISDGASDAFDSGSWAQRLTRSFVDSPPGWSAEAILTWLTLPAALWRTEIHWENLPWYCQEKARIGSFSTLLALVPEPHDGDAEVERMRLNALAVGDSCLFHTRARVLLSVFPDMTPDDFGNSPALLSTDRRYSERSLKEMQTTQLSCNPGDVLFMATDALSAWLLSEHRNGTPVWNDLSEMNSDAFRELVGHLRARGRMKNDDVTLVVIDIGSSSSR